jgi:NAD-dependent deacetylase
MRHVLPAEAVHRLHRLLEEHGSMIVLTGAGISAESGIPTFRGKEGYWVAGSREYQPLDMATFRMFQRDPEAVWAWYLYRRGVCHAAQPNEGHRAIVELERRFGDRFRLITQNVDGLHIRAGNTLDRSYQIHGNINFARCARECGQAIWSLPELPGPARKRNEPLTDNERQCLRCPACGGWARPHILWFDECYDEEHFRFESSIRAAAEAELLLVAGTSGVTNLPLQVGRYAAATGTLILDINIEPNPFSRLAESCGGVFLQGTSAALLPAIAEYLTG